MDAGSIREVRVRVPASSGNLGPGFDALGMAYAIHDEVTAMVSPAAVPAAPRTEVTVTGEGAGELPLNDSHLVVRAMRRTFEVNGVPQPDITLACVNTIPHGKGLGSSAAAVIAGILAARAYLPKPNDYVVPQILATALEFEGHPDNIAPALLGGAVAAWVEGGQPKAAVIEVAKGVAPVLLVPEAVLPTTTARAVLPESVPFADAAFNAGRAALMVAALASQPEHLLAASADKLHQDNRASSMPESVRLVAQLREAGFAAMVSGAGPTVLVLGAPGAKSAEWSRRLAEITPAGWRVLNPQIDRQGAIAAPIFHT